MLNLLIVLIVIGVAIWAVTTFIPMDASIKTIIRVVGIVIALIYVAKAFGLIGALSGVDVPKLR